MWRKMSLCYLKICLKKILPEAVLLTCNVIMPLLIDIQPIVFLKLSVWPTLVPAQTGEGGEVCGDGSSLNCFNKLPIVWILDKLSASRHGACNHSIRQFSGDLLTWTQVRTFITKCFSAKWANEASCVVSINDDVGVSPGPSLSRVTIHVSRFCPVWQSLIESHIRRNKVQLNTRNARSWYNGAVSVKCRPGIRIWCSDTFLPLV